MNALITLVGQSDPLISPAPISEQTSTGSIILPLIIGLVVVVIMLAAYWKLFVKMNEPGWHGIVPIYNTFKLFENSGKSGWLILLFLIPCVNIVGLWLLADSIGDIFGKGIGYKIGLFLFSPIFVLILAFGGDQAVGLVQKGAGAVPPAPPAPPIPPAPAG